MPFFHFSSAQLSFEKYSLCPYMKLHPIRRESSTENSKKDSPFLVTHPMPGFALWNCESLSGKVILPLSSSLKQCSCQRFTCSERNSRPATTGHDVPDGLPQVCACRPLVKVIMPAEYHLHPVLVEHGNQVLSHVSPIVQRRFLPAAVGDAAERRLSVEPQSTQRTHRRSQELDRITGWTR